MDHCFFSLKSLAYNGWISKIVLLLLISAFLRMNWEYKKLLNLTIIQSASQSINNQVFLFAFFSTLATLNALKKYCGAKNIEKQKNQQLFNYRMHFKVPSTHLVTSTQNLLTSDHFSMKYHIT